MYNVHKPDASELPPSGKLLRSTGIAAVIAGALLVTVVLPAEYAVDPTGIGGLIGLTEMGRIKMALAAEAEQEAASVGSADAQAETLMTPETLAAAPTAKGPSADATSPASSQAHKTSLTLAPDQGAEIKLVMREGAQAQYVWSTNGGRVNFDVHGDGAGVDYHGYGKGSATRAEGVMTAAFDGNHGWFWRNRTDAAVTITLQTSGDYAEIKRVG